MTQKPAPAQPESSAMMKIFNDAVAAVQKGIGHEITQLRMPLVVAAGVGRLGFSVSWMFLWIQLAFQIYTVVRQNRLPRPHRRKQMDPATMPYATAAQPQAELLASGTTKAMFRQILISVELYFHLIIGVLLAFYIGSLRMDLLLLLPIVETVVFVEKQLLLLRLKVTGTHSTIPELEVEENSETVVIEDFESFKAMLSTTPIHVDTEWMNMLLAQFWQLYSTWSEEFVRSQIEFYTNGLGLKCENSTLGKIPITLRNVTGKRRRVFVGSSQEARSDEDLIYDLDLHIEWAAIPCIQLSFAGIKLTVNSLFLSGILRGELKWFEINEQDGDFLSPQFPNLTGITIYFTERPTLRLSLSVMGLFDLLSLPLLDWVVDKFVVDNIVCGLMGPQGDKIVPMVLYDFKDDMIAARDRARGVGGDLDAVSKRFRPCQLVVTVQGAENVPVMDNQIGGGSCDPYVVLHYGVRDSVQWKDEEKKTQHQDDSLEPVWNAKFEWFTNSDDDELEITMYDHDAVGSDDVIGSWKTTLGDLRRDLKLHLKKVAVPHQVYISGDHPKGPPKLNLSIQFRNFTTHIDGCEDGTQLSDVQLLKGVGGILRVKLLRCEKLKRGDDDIYVVFYIGKQDAFGQKLILDNSGKPHRCEEIKQKELNRIAVQCKKSETVKNSTEPEWNEKNPAEWEMEIEGGASEFVVAALVWDDDVHGDDLLGSCVFELKYLTSRNTGARFLTTMEDTKRQLIAPSGSKLVDDDGAPSTIDFICDFLPNEEQVQNNKAQPEAAQPPPRADSISQLATKHSPRHDSADASSVSPRKSDLATASPRKSDVASPSLRK